MELKEQNIQNQETDVCGRDNRPEIEKLKRKEMMITETTKKTETKKYKSYSSPDICEISQKVCQVSVEGKI